MGEGDLEVGRSSPHSSPRPESLSARIVRYVRSRKSSVQPRGSKEIEGSETLEISYGSAELTGLPELPRRPERELSFSRFITPDFHARSSRHNSEDGERPTPRGGRPTPRRGGKYEEKRLIRRDAPFHQSGTKVYMDRHDSLGLRSLIVKDVRWSTDVRCSAEV